MPFDSAPQLDVATEEDLSFATGREGLRRLALMLRREMPERFHWDYGEFMKTDHQCRTRGCALGLARLQWPQFAEVVERMVTSYYAAASEVFGISTTTSQALFSEVGLERVFRTRADTTPAMVADAIDRYLSASR